jgi:hypothetical protein
MLKRDVQKLHNGVYRIYWKSGGTSVAAVGRTPKGSCWIAPTNWVSGSTDDLSEWHKIERVEMITDT